MRDTVKIPVAVLKSGENRQVRLDLEFPDAPVTFTLIQVSFYNKISNSLFYGPTFFILLHFHTCDSWYDNIVKFTILFLD